MRLVRLALALLLAGCSSVTAPPSPIDLAGVEGFKATAEYAQWWADISACSGIVADADGPTYYVVDELIVVNGEGFSGYWIRSGNKIVVVEPWAHDEKLVKHEMMHAHLQDAGHGHPVEFFKGACGDLTLP